MPFDSDAPVEVTTRDRLIRLRDFLAELTPSKFSMNHWNVSAANAAKWADRHQHECGTVCCIGGWTQALFDGPEQEESTQRAAQLLGLTADQSSRLFWPFDQKRAATAPKWDDVLPHHAVKVLDHYLATGEVDWSVAFK